VPISGIRLSDWLHREKEEPKPDSQSETPPTTMFQMTSEMWWRVGGILAVGLFLSFGVGNPLPLIVAGLVAGGVEWAIHYEKEKKKADTERADS
jgi:hypothetical protein